jgi:hypothetical protein
MVRLSGPDSWGWIDIIVQPERQVDEAGHRCTWRQVARRTCTQRYCTPRTCLVKQCGIIFESSLGPREGNKMLTTMTGRSP